MCRRAPSKRRRGKAIFQHLPFVINVIYWMLFPVLLVRLSLR